MVRAGSAVVNRGWEPALSSFERYTGLGGIGAALPTMERLRVVLGSPVIATLLDISGVSHAGPG
jgi:hypothetical protein